MAEKTGEASVRCLDDTSICAFRGFVIVVMGGHRVSVDITSRSGLIIGGREHSVSEDLRFMAGCADGEHSVSPDIRFMFIALVDPLLDLGVFDARVLEVLVRDNSVGGLEIRGNGSDCVECMVELLVTVVRSSSEAVCLGGELNALSDILLLGLGAI